jgi:hypothetical protein
MTQKLKSSMDEEKKITKIVVSKEDELTDLVSSLLDAPNERIILTFAEETDLLISPINLKVLLETADEREKLVIAQIIKNPTGLRNANLAGITTIDTPSFPEEELWEKEEENRLKRLSPPKKESPKKEKVETPSQNAEPQRVSDFQKRVDEAIQKSREKRAGREEHSDDILISLDEDLPQREELREKPSVKTEPGISKTEPDLSTVDFSKKTQEPSTVKASERLKKKDKGPSFFVVWGGKIKAFFKKMPVPDKFKKLAPIIGISVGLLLALIGFIYINTAVIAKVDIYVEAKEVELEEIFQGDENIKEIDFENLRIPVKTETVEKARSTNIAATGTAFRGEKAKGPINIVYPGDGNCDEDTPPLELPAEITLSAEGKSYTLDGPVSVACGSIAEGSTTAVEVGEEYNLSQGKRFTFQGYSSDSLFALNSNKALTGGSKEEYTILSKADVDAGVNQLQGVAIEEGENELREKTGTWEIISDSISSEVIPDSIQPEVPIGSEANQVNLSIRTKSTATYFLKEGFDEGIEERLTQKAEDENLFESEGDWKLELDEDIEKEISVVEINAQGVRIKLIARSSVKPTVDRDSIAEELKDMNWEEGNSYLKDLSFSEKETRVEFLPEWFPEGLRYFPKRRGGVMISVKDVK